VSAKPQLIPLKDGWILSAGRDYSPGKGVTRGALMLTKAELADVRTLLNGDQS
jgi:hypothetical protein